MTKKNVVVFDLDGTLLYTIESIAYHLNKTLVEYGLQAISREKVLEYVGNSSRYLVEKAVADSDPNMDGDRVTALLDDYNESYFEDPLPMTRPYPGMEVLLKALKDHGCRLAVFSNKPDGIAKRVVEHFFGEGFFSFIRGFLEEIPRKPDKACMDRLLQDMGAEAEQVVYVGDSDVDGMTGENAGLDTVLVTYGYRSRDQLARFSQAELVDSVEELGHALASRGLLEAN